MRGSDSAPFPLVNKSPGPDELPRRGRIVSELNDKTVCELSLYSYRTLYEIKASHIEILAVIHKRRNMQAKGIRRGNTDD